MTTVEGHQLLKVGFSPRSRKPFQAVCVCGWLTPGFTNAGLAESVFDAHLRCEHARATSAKAALMRLETLAQRERAQQTRHRFAELRVSIADRLGHPAGLGPPGGRVTVITVDDDPKLQHDLARALASEPGFHLIGQGHSGVDAVAWASVEQPDVMVLDDAMPGMDGVEAASLIRYVAPLARVCLYAEKLTSFDQADLLVPKDVTPKDLLRQLSWLAA